MLVNIYRIIKFSINSYFRNFWLTLITVSTIFATLILISSAILFHNLFNHVLGQFQEKFDVSIYLNTDATPENVQLLIQKIEEKNISKEISQMTPEQSLEKFKNDFKDNDVILSALGILGENPLGYTVIVKMKHKDLYEQLNSLLKEPEYSQFIYLENQGNTQDYEALRNKISRVSDTVSYIVLLVVLIFFLYSLLVLNNTIKMGIYSQREEIGIMRLVGADSWFIKMPFIFESILYSITAVCVLIPAVYFSISFLQPLTDSFLEEYSFSFLTYINQNFFSFFGFQLALSIIINMFASYISVSKYIKF